MKAKTILLGSALMLGGLVASGHTQQAHAATLNSDNNTVTVQSGDTLWSIGKQFNTTVNNLMSLNNLHSDLIMPRQQLKLHGVINNAKPVATIPVTKIQSVATQPVVSSQPRVQHVTTAGNNNSNDNSTAAAMAYIANRESGGNYNARNGQYVGKWQLSSSYLHGDYSPANQDRVANQYVQSRYGSWQNAAQHERTYGWY